MPYRLDRFARLCRIQYGQQRWEAVPGFVALGADDLGGHLEGNAAHLVPDVVLSARRAISHRTSSPLGITRPAAYLHFGHYHDALFFFLPAEIQGAVELVLRFRAGLVQEGHSGGQPQLPPLPVRLHHEDDRCRGTVAHW